MQGTGLADPVVDVEDDEVFISPGSSAAGSLATNSTRPSTQLAGDTATATPPSSSLPVTPASTTGEFSTPGTTPNPFDAFDGNGLRRSARRNVKRKSCTDPDQDDTPVIRKRALARDKKTSKARNMQHSPRKSTSGNHPGASACPDAPPDPNQAIFNRMQAMFGGLEDKLGKMENNLGGRIDGVET